MRRMRLSLQNTSRVLRAYFKPWVTLQCCIILPPAGQQTVDPIARTTSDRGWQRFIKEMLSLSVAKKDILQVCHYAVKALPGKPGLRPDVCKVNAQALLGGKCSNLQHPGRWVHARLEGGDPRDGLEVADQLRRIRAGGPRVDGLAAALQQVQLIERLQAAVRR